MWLERKVCLLKFDVGEEEPSAIPRKQQKEPQDAGAQVRRVMGR